MSLQAKQGYVVPNSTAQVARAILPEGSPVMRRFDELHMIVTDHDCADLFPARGQPAEAPVRLALATLLQFMEGLTDRQAAHAVRTRIDWRYLLCLELSDTGCDHTVLSEFRSRLLEHGAEQRRIDAVLMLAKTRGVLKAGGRQRSALHSCAGHHAGDDPARRRGRDAAPCARRTGYACSRVAAGPHDARVGEPLRPAFQRVSPAPQRG